MTGRVSVPGGRFKYGTRVGVRDTPGRWWVSVPPFTSTRGVLVGVTPDDADAYLYLSACTIEKGNMMARHLEDVAPWEQVFQRMRA